MKSCKSLLPEVKEITPFGRGNQIRLCKFLRNPGFYLPTGNPPVVQLEFISRYLSCLSGVWGIGISFRPDRGDQSVWH